MAVVPGGQCEPMEVVEPWEDSISDRMGQVSGTHPTTAATSLGSLKKNGAEKTINIICKAFGENWGNSDNMNMKINFFFNPHGKRSLLLLNGVVGLL